MAFPTGHSAAPYVAAVSGRTRAKWCEGSAKKEPHDPRWCLGLAQDQEAAGTGLTSPGRDSQGSYQLRHQAEAKLGTAGAQNLAHGREAAHPAVDAQNALLAFPRRGHCVQWSVPSYTPPSCSWDYFAKF